MVVEKRRTSDDTDETLAAILELGPWFHNIHLPGGMQTAPDHFLGDFPNYKWKMLEPHIPKDLQGWTALDIGCNAGFYSLELAARGAYVVGIDCNTRYLKQARWASEQFGLQDRTDFRLMQVYDLARVQDKYDLVLFMGVFYHLRYPLLALDIVAQLVRKLMVFQTLRMAGDDIYAFTEDAWLFDRESMHDRGWPKMAFIEHRFAGDPTNWWIPNRAGIEAMLRSSGMRLLERVDEETYICKPRACPTSRGCASPEFLAATGRPWKTEED